MQFGKLEAEFEIKPVNIQNTKVALLGEVTLEVAQAIWPANLFNPH